MKTILYIHGFASSGNSGTATMLRNLLYNDGVRVLSPDVPVSPLAAVDMLRQTVADEHPDLIIGTSMGGMYAELLRGVPRILVNPGWGMAKRLMFRGLGNHEFFNKRADGATSFKVDRQMIDEFRQVESHSFEGIDSAERERVWGLFGKNDPMVHTQPDFRRHYGEAHLIVFEGEHRLNDKVLKGTVLPLVTQILQSTQIS